MDREFLEEELPVRAVASSALVLLELVHGLLHALVEELQPAFVCGTLPHSVILAFVSCHFA